jgi:PTH1 family peptidyl-tRNA hydrolase|tara:strand:+ start:490 stop:1053 length:564 start_codon:yes stop_codon:yes gene_type:complete
VKYLIAGLGNIGTEYVNTRHNIGFEVVNILTDELKGESNIERLAVVSRVKFRGRSLIIIKPTTFMNLSGKAIKYWLDKEKIPNERLLVILDDIALPIGTLRIKAKGGDAGHNGLTDIIDKLGTNVFARLRIGIGDNFPKGRQSDYVLGCWTKSEEKLMIPRIEIASEIIKSFTVIGVGSTMTTYNNK